MGSVDCLSMLKKQLCAWGVPQGCLQRWLAVAGILVSGIWASDVQASCTSPSGPEGSLNYSTSNHRFEFCDQSNTWQPLSGSSGATGVEDHIISGTTSLYANGTNYISVTTNGTVTGYWDTAGRFITPGISVTNAYGVSSTNGMFSGKVSIGTSSAPAAPLQVVGGTGANVATLVDNNQWYSGKASGGSAVRLIGLSNTNDVYLGAVDNNTGKIIFREDGTDRMTISSGNVGIGVSSPAAKLNVAGTISASDAVQVGQSTLSCASSISGSIRYNTTSDTLQICTGSGWKSLASTTTAGVATAASSTGSIQFNSGGSFAGDTSNLFWDDTNNRLAVGMSSPLYTLDISGTSRFKGTVRIQKATTGATTVTMIDGGSVNSWGLTAGSDGSFSLNDLTSGPSPIIVQAGAIDSSVYIASGSKVGINTTSPLANLDISGTISATNAIQIGSSSLSCSTGIPGAIRYNSTSNTLQICLGSTWTSLVSSTGGGTIDGAGSTNHIAYWSDANTLTYDSSQLYWDATNNRLGIGTDTPGYKLDVNGAIHTNNNVRIDNVLYLGRILDQIVFDGNNDAWWWVSKGAPTGTYAFGVYSPAGDGGSNSGFVFYINENGTAWLKSTLTQNSDIRLKEDIRPFNNALDVISKLNGVRFKWKDKNMPGEQIGFIAQDVEKVLPELVATNPEDKMKSVAYTSVIPILTEAVKQLKAENEALGIQLKAANDNQAAEMRAMRAEFEAYKAAHP